MGSSSGKIEAQLALYVITRILFGALYRKVSASLRVAVGRGRGVACDVGDRLGGAVAVGGPLVGGGVGVMHAASVARTRTRGCRVGWFMLAVGHFYSSGMAPPIEVQGTRPPGFIPTNDAVRGVVSQASFPFTHVASVLEKKTSPRVQSRWEGRLYAEGNGAYCDSATSRAALV